MSPDEHLMEAMCKLVVLYELESIEASGVKITKKLHRVAPTAPMETPGETIPAHPEPTEEDVMMFSTYEKRFSVEDLAKMGDRTRGAEPEPEH